MYDEEDAGSPAMGIVPTEGRGSMPFTLMHGESLVAVASWALGEAGVELLDFTTSWEQVLERGTALVFHDPLCPGTPVGFLAEAVRVAVAGDTVVAGARPVTDTVRTVEDGVLGAPVDRTELLAVTSPVVVPASVLAALPAMPDADDLADLVVSLRAQHPVLLLEAPASSRRVVDESDVRLLEAG